MRRLVIAALLTSLALPAAAADQPAQGGASLTEDQKTLYAVGQVMARQLSVFELSPEEAAVVKQGLSDGLAGKPALVDMNAYKTKIQQLAEGRRDAQGKRLAALATKVTEQAAKEKGAVQTASGLVYVPVKEGAGAKPAATDRVKVNYRGTFADGKEFDSSYGSGQPAEFALSQVIKCWTEGLQLMKAGGKAKLVCPSAIAYGERGSGPIPPNSTLLFDVELLEVVK
jgi:FKBP-type peptidyl-prolyl cis-trans isomerase FkpA